MASEAGYFARAPEDSDDEYVLRQEEERGQNTSIPTTTERKISGNSGDFPPTPMERAVACLEKLTWLVEKSQEPPPVPYDMLGILVTGSSDKLVCCARKARGYLRGGCSIAEFTGANPYVREILIALALQLTMEKRENELEHLVEVRDGLQLFIGQYIPTFNFEAERAYRRFCASVGI